MAKERRIKLENTFYYINTKALFSTNWGTNKLKGDYKDGIISKLDKIV